MQIELIRSATLRLKMAGQTLLIDPWLAAKGQGRSYSGGLTSPLVDLPVAVDHVLRGIDAVLVSHLHSDHFDDVAKQLLPPDISLFCHPRDVASIRAMGFSRVMSLEGTTQLGNVHLETTDGQHGPLEVLADMGDVSGFVLRAAGEPVLYWAGDTILCDSVRQVLVDRHPDVIVVHACGAEWNGVGPLVMDAAMVMEVLHLAPQAMVIATHLDAVDHATVSRTDLAAAAQRQGPDVRARLYIPADGASLFF
ncbi:MBL fold metallo-hydrolase [Agrobacterium vitis]|uniref:MBL fold metallo-hydrolase n=1 Tax=Agrobacterium vitis TaxID=373 RepID=UPI00087275B4|nr:MBL fold metallo-hydrolase [Agrobacterium vitis]MCE6073469.1 MBL fold metallo-hydrolase [Agrobacterium vitis]MCF1467481.1 MBL fold metallo-hydrolase [Agrobacterium vitis]MCM2452695.1 MBL fold metallo-hydrolase [Agrobacterium vitis]MCM2469400.1 MBL fold metallo-hydrolase [Agrobacterium vitis]MUO69127.1 MBL fold metallo-hydrolase [Agrobacterium vitis]